MKKENIYTRFNSTLNYMYTQLPMFQRVGSQAFKKDLTNIKLLCEHLGNPFEKYPCIHIAGTNGKGSTAHLISAILQEHGYKVGLYTSPHYRDFRERIKNDGKYISRKYVVGFVNNHKAIFEEIKPSFFEITVAMAFDFFAKEKVDIAVIETGLGGRLDSTNIITPILSVVTNISFDHQQFLGNTLKKIAGEKAGIIKKNIPVVIGEMQEETIGVFEKKAKAKKSSITFADQNYQVVKKSENLTHTKFDIFKNGQPLFSNQKINLHGAYQAKNIATALQAMDSLPNNFLIKKTKIATAFFNLKTLTNFKGRWQVLQKDPIVLCDSAHNEAGLSLAMSQLKLLKANELHFVLGMVNDKSIEKMLNFFPKDANFYFCKPNIPRGLEVDLLVEKATELGLKGKAYSSVKNALRAAKKKAGKKDLVYVGGSTFVVAEVI
ncbi:MAG: folylpolyglutamate synthase/dihydrofolate synthase family protein [Saprospiraceae bacterium]